MIEWIGRPKPEGELNERDRERAREVIAELKALIGDLAFALEFRPLFGQSDEARERLLHRARLATSNRNKWSP